MLENRLYTFILCQRSSLEYSVIGGHFALELVNKIFSVLGCSRDFFLGFDTIIFRILGMHNKKED